MSKLNTCPECSLFLYACKCKQPIETRIPTSREIHNYLDCKEIGLVPNEAFVLGFKAGWEAYHNHLKDFLSAQLVSGKPKEEKKPCHH